jgi:hypothetical protein
MYPFGISLIFPKKTLTLWNGSGQLRAFDQNYLKLPSIIEKG